MDCGVAQRDTPHVSDDETVANMGHPAGDMARLGECMLCNAVCIIMGWTRRASSGYGWE